MIKNEYDEKIEEEIDKLSSNLKEDSNNNLEEILFIMENNSYFKSIKKLKLRFWDMFIIEAFINNNDRNETNWGLILNKDTNDLRISPVYDNGASFYNKSSDERLISIFEDEFKFKQSVYDSSISIFRLNGKFINPLKYIESMNNNDCNEALKRIVPLINMDKITDMFNSIPQEYNGLPILSNVQKKYYLRSLEYKYNNILLPIYNKLLEKNNT